MAYYNAKETRTVPSVVSNPLQGLGFTVHMPVIGDVGFDTGAITREAIANAWPDIHDRALSLVPEVIDTAWPQLEQRLPGLVNQAMGTAMQQVPTLINQAMNQAIPIASQAMEKFVNQQAPVLEAKLRSAIPGTEYVQYIKPAAMVAGVFALLVGTASVITIVKSRKK
jgi:hypothetical protein